MHGEKYFYCTSYAWRKVLLLYFLCMEKSTFIVLPMHGEKYFYCTSYAWRKVLLLYFLWRKVLLLYFLWRKVLLLYFLWRKVLLLYFMEKSTFIVLPMEKSTFILLPPFHYTFSVLKSMIWVLKLNKWNFVSCHQFLEFHKGKRFLFHKWTFIVWSNSEYILCGLMFTNDFSQNYNTNPSQDVLKKNITSNRSLLFRYYCHFPDV